MERDYSCSCRIISKRGTQAKKDFIQKCDLCAAAPEMLDALKCVRTSDPTTLRIVNAAIDRAESRRR